VSPNLRGWFGLGSAPDVPQEVRDRMHGERVLAASAADDGTWLVGTRDGLHALGEGSTSWPWEQVLRADWDEETGQLLVVPVGEFGRPVDQRTFALDDAADLLTLVRERVSASVVLQRHVAVSGKRGFLLFARRPPGGGEISWAFEMDPGVDPADPAVRGAMDAALADARASVGVVES
jgi:hypothetical protein